MWMHFRMICLIFYFRGDLASFVQILLLNYHPRNFQRLWVLRLCFGLRVIHLWIILSVFHLCSCLCRENSCCQDVACHAPMLFRASVLVYFSSLRLCCAEDQSDLQKNPLQHSTHSLYQNRDTFEMTTEAILPFFEAQAVYKSEFHHSFLQDIGLEIKTRDRLRDSFVFDHNKAE